MCTMDMSKAFDMTLRSLLFSKMLKAGLSVIFICLLIYIYSEPFANVRLNGQISPVFPMHNVLLPIVSTVSNSLNFLRSATLVAGWRTCSWVYWATVTITSAWHPSYILCKRCWTQSCCCHPPRFHVQHAYVLTCLQNSWPGIVMKGFEPAAFGSAFWSEVTEGQ